jgi:hypothetical protein
LLGYEIYAESLAPESHWLGNLSGLEISLGPESHWVRIPNGSVSPLDLYWLCYCNWFLWAATKNLTCNSVF